MKTVGIKYWELNAIIIGKKTEKYECTIGHGCRVSSHSSLVIYHRLKSVNDGNWQKKKNLIEI